VIIKTSIGSANNPTTIVLVDKDWKMTDWNHLFVIVTQRVKWEITFSSLLLDYQMMMMGKPLARKLQMCSGAL
jgi:hypothetical protein